MRIKYKDKIMKLYKNLNNVEEYMLFDTTIETQKDFEKAAYRNIVYFTNSLMIKSFKDGNNINPALFRILAQYLFESLYDQRFFEVFEFIFFNSSLY